MSNLNSNLIKKVVSKLGKKEKYIREQISKRARKERVVSEVALINWAHELGIPTSAYVRRLSPTQQMQIQSTIPSNGVRNTKSQTFRIVQIGSNEHNILNQLWFQIVVLGLGVNIFAQIIAVCITNYFHLTHP